MSSEQISHCALCKSVMGYAPGIGPYCPNKDCENIDGPPRKFSPLRGDSVVKDSLTPAPTSQGSGMDLDEAEQKIETASAELGRLCDARWKGGEAWEKAWHWEIPANPKKDTDLRIGDAIGLAKDLLAEVRRLRSALSPAAPVQAGGAEVLGEVPGQAA